jgi:hypothetical protein
MREHGLLPIRIPELSIQLMWVFPPSKGGVTHLIIKFRCYFGKKYGLLLAYMEPVGGFLMTNLCPVLTVFPPK